MNNISNTKRRGIIILAAAICIVVLAVVLCSVSTPFHSHNEKRFESDDDFIKFVDVGQGDSAIIYSNGYCAVIDVGLPDTAAELSERLGEYGITQIDAVIISHLNSDHVGGLPHIAERFKIKNLIMPELYDDSILSAVNGKDIAIKNGSAFYTAVQGMNFTIGEFELTLLNNQFERSDSNNGSIFVMAKIGDTKALFAGDAEALAEELLLKENLNLDCDILKVGHHGSDTSTSKSFLKATTPKHAVISVGKDNIFDHPHKVTLDALKDIGAKVYRTDTRGDIAFSFSESDYEIVEQK